MRDANEMDTLSPRRDSGSDSSQQTFRNELVTLKSLSASGCQQSKKVFSVAPTRISRYMSFCYKATHTSKNNANKPFQFHGVHGAIELSQNWLLLLPV